MGSGSRNCLAPLFGVGGSGKRNGVAPGEASARAELDAASVPIGAFPSSSAFLLCSI